MKLLVVNTKTGASQIVTAGHPKEVKQMTGWFKSDIVTAIIPSDITPEKEWLTRKELSNWLGIHANTIFRWTKRNKIPFIHMGKALAYNREDILGWIETQKATCESAIQNRRNQ